MHAFALNQFVSRSAHPGRRESGLPSVEGARVRFVVAVGCAALLAGCAATPTRHEAASSRAQWARLDDTGAQETRGKARFFAAVAIDGEPIVNSLDMTRRVNRGQDALLSPVFMTRDVEARPMKVRLVGSHLALTPMYEIASKAVGTFLSVEGVVDFRPVSGLNYEVAGSLSRESACVWIVEALTRRVVTDRVCTTP